MLKYGEGNRAGRREGQVSLTLSRCGLLHGFNHYLAHGSEFDQHVAYALLGDERKELLRQDGKARIIQVAVPGDIALNRANRYLTVDERVARGEVPPPRRRVPQGLELYTDAPGFRLRHGLL